MSGFNFFFHESSSDKDENRCKQLFYTSSGSADMCEKHKFQKQVDVFFLLLTVYYFSDGYEESPPPSFMSGGYDPSSPHHHLQPHQDHYSPQYGGYSVQPPLGSDSGSAVSGYTPIPPPEGFSPVHKDYHREPSQQHHGPHGSLTPQGLHPLGPSTATHEHWNNNDRTVETSYDCY